MKLAKIINLNDKVQVIVRKAVINGKHGFDMNYLGWVEGDKIATATITMEYSKASTRDKDFDNMNKAISLRLGKGLLTFRDLLDEEN